MMEDVLAFRVDPPVFTQGMNGDIVPAGKTAVSTSNRNFEGRQGAGARTLLASPATAAASAVLGKVARSADILGESEGRR